MRGAAGCEGDEGGGRRARDAAASGPTADDGAKRPNSEDLRDRSARPFPTTRRFAARGEPAAPERRSKIPNSAVSRHRSAQGASKGQVWQGSADAWQGGFCTAAPTRLRVLRPAPGAATAAPHACGSCPAPPRARLGGTADGIEDYASSTDSNILSRLAAITRPPACFRPVVRYRVDLAARYAKPAGSCRDGRETPQKSYPGARIPGVPQHRPMPDRC